MPKINDNLIYSLDFDLLQKKLKMYSSRVIKFFMTKSLGLNGSRMMSSLPKYEALSVSIPKEYVYQVELNRPKKLNALNYKMWTEIGDCFKVLGDSSDCRVVILKGSGKAFSAGIDLHDTSSFGQILSEHSDVARRCREMEKRIKLYQDCFLSLEKCRKPVIAAIHGPCIGGAMNLICGADIRYCSKSAWFSLKEVDIGMAADVGALQWLPKIIGSESFVRELAFTARRMSAEEALQCGLTSRLFNDDETLFNESLKLAEEISKKSPVAVQTTKMTLVHARDHPIQDGLDYIRNINQTMLQSEDFINAAMSQATKESETVVFSKL